MTAMEGVVPPPAATPVGTQPEHTCDGNALRERWCAACLKAECGCDDDYRREPARYTPLSEIITGDQP